MTLAMPYRVDLQFQQGRLILTFGDLRLTAGVGLHQLAFPFSHSATWFEQDANTANVSVILTARVHATTTGVRWIGDVTSRVFTVRCFAVPDELVVGLTDAQLLALDAERRDGPLPLQLDLVGTLLHLPGGVHPTMNTTLTLITQPEAWLKNLDRIGSDPHPGPEPPDRSGRGPSAFHRVERRSGRLPRTGHRPPAASPHRAGQRSV